MRNLSSLILAVLFLAALLGILLRHYLRARVAAEATWDDLLRRLVWVDSDNIATIALDAIDESGGQHLGDAAYSLEPAAIWSLLGGLEGVEALQHNCQVLVDLACYAQKRYPEALVVAEQLRLNAREIEWHVERLKGAAQRGNLQTAFADYAQRAAVVYYGMTRHVLDLYEHGGFPGLADLQKAL